MVRCSCQNSCLLYTSLNGLRGEFTEEKTKYVDFLVKNEALTNDINALTKEKDVYKRQNLVRLPPDVGK